MFFLCFLINFGRFWRFFNSDWKTATQTKKFDFFWHPVCPKFCQTSGVNEILNKYPNVYQWQYAWLTPSTNEPAIQPTSLAAGQTVFSVVDLLYKKRGEKKYTSVSKTVDTIHTKPTRRSKTFHTTLLPTLIISAQLKGKIFKSDRVHQGPGIWGL